MRHSDMRHNVLLDGTYSKECDLCVQGQYGRCWSTANGCEPFAVWKLEADIACGTGLQIKSGSRYLGVGWHPIRVEYFQRGGPASFRLRYNGTDTNNALLDISEKRLMFPESAGLQMDMFEVPALTATLPPFNLMGMVPGGAFMERRIDSAIAHPPGESPFSSELALITKPLYLRWTGFLNIKTASQYTFQLSCRDGCRLIMGGRGRGESILIDNDGKKDISRAVSVTLWVLAGKHPIRAEYFWAPELGQYLRSPPGIVLSYSGMDTGRVMKTVAAVSITDDECESSSIAWNGGLSQSRDCIGTCFDGRETKVGDGICDGRPTSTGAPAVLDFRCSAYAEDNNDCSPVVASFSPDIFEGISCFSTCPSRNWKRRSCSHCAEPAHWQGLCPSKHPPGCNATTCLFRQCCVAKIWGVDYWDKDCISFGAYDDCTGTLQRMIKSMRREGLGYVDGELTTQCSESNCNSLPTGYVLLNFRPTQETLCPANSGETSNPGLMCFEGPWEGMPEACQTGRRTTEDTPNFCRNRKTFDGKPFTTCCVLGYLNENTGRIGCKYTGVERGTCISRLEELGGSIGGPSTRVATTMLVSECFNDLCNYPIDPNMCETFGNSIDAEQFRMEKSTTTPPLALAVNSYEAGPPWLVIGICSGAGVVLIGATVYICKPKKLDALDAYGINKNKVYVVSVENRCWVEKAEDKDGQKFGIIKPVPLPLKVKKDPVPRALRWANEAMVEAEEAKLSEASAERRKITISGNYLQLTHTAVANSVPSSKGFSALGPREAASLPALGDQVIAIACIDPQTDAPEAPVQDPTWGADKVLVSRPPAISRLTRQGEIAPIQYPGYAGGPSGAWAGCL